MDVENFAEPTTGHIIWIDVPIKNVGKTTARLKKIVATRMLVAMPTSGLGIPGKLPETPEYDPTPTVQIDGRDIIIAPGATLKHMHVYIWPDDLGPIRRREVSLYVYGFVEYLDTVKGTETHRTCFCSIYWIPETRLNEPTGFMFSPIIPPAYFCAT